MMELQLTPYLWEFANVCLFLKIFYLELLWGNLDNLRNYTSRYLEEIWFMDQSLIVILFSSLFSNSSVF